jgi:hypothetical protein
LTRLIHPESQLELQNHLALEDAGMLSEQALAAGVIQLYAQKLKKVVVADELQIAPGKVTDNKLAVLCDSIRDDPPDILVLCGCRGGTNFSCLMQLSTISHLDISDCNLGAEGGFHLAGVIKVMRALTLLNISLNNLKAEGAKTVFEAIKVTNCVIVVVLAPFVYAHLTICWTAVVYCYPQDNGAMTNLNLASNKLGVEGAKIIAACLPKCT